MPDPELERIVSLTDGDGDRSVVTVLVVDDHPMIRQGLRECFEGTSLDIVGEADSGEEAIRLNATLHPDVIFMDLRMPGIGGIEATRRIQDQVASATVIMLSAEVDISAVHPALDAGAKGYMPKESAPEELVAAVHAALRGEIVIHPGIAQGLIRAANPPSDPPANHQLSARQRTVLQAVAEGLSDAQIAEKLGLSTQTVRTHLDRSFLKLGARSRSQAVAIAIQQGALELEALPHA